MEINLYKNWEECSELVEHGNIDEALVFAVCRAKTLGVPQPLIDKIIKVSLVGFQKKVLSKMDECIVKAREENAKALCLYYDIDNGWDSTMYICAEYSKKNIYWVTKSRSWVDIGKARGFSGIFRQDAESAFFSDELSSGICLLLMLKTTLAFYHAVQGYRDCGFKLCITCTESDFVLING